MLDRLQQSVYRERFENQQDFYSLSEALGITSWMFPGDPNSFDEKASPEEVLNQMEERTLNDQIQYISQLESGVGAQIQWDTLLQIAHQAGATAAHSRWKGPFATATTSKDYSRVLRAIQGTFFCTGPLFPPLEIKKSTSDSTEFGLSLVSKLNPTSILMLYQLWLHWQKGYVHILDARIQMRFRPDSHYYWVEWH